MRLMSYTTGILCAVAVSLGDGAHGQAFPSKTVRIVTVAAGGSVDIGARLIAQGISGPPWPKRHHRQSRGGHHIR